MSSRLSTGSLEAYPHGAATIVTNRGVMPASVNSARTSSFSSRSRWRARALVSASKGTGTCAMLNSGSSAGWYPGTIIPAWARPSARPAYISPPEMREPE